MKILLDPGHGDNTCGKCSPDGRFREYAYNRLIAGAVVQHLQYRGFDAEVLVPESEDISLPERVRRVNTFCHKLGRKEVCLVSVHVNAAGKGDRWYQATGWSCYTSPGQTAGDKLADALYEAARIELPGRRIRKDYTDGDQDLEANFYLLRHTLCAAALTENEFMDCEESLRFLESDEGKLAIVALHVNGIVNFVKNQQTKRI